MSLDQTHQQNIMNKIGAEIGMVVMQNGCLDVNGCQSENIIYLIIFQLAMVLSFVPLLFVVECKPSKFTAMFLSNYMKIEWGNCGNITTNIGFIYNGHSCLKEVLIKLVSSSIQREQNRSVWTRTLLAFWHVIS